MSSEFVSSTVLEADRDLPFERLRISTEELRVDADDAVLLRIDRFGISTNNLGYALLGDVLRSWDAYPSPTPGWGRVPVWGTATVIAADARLAPVGSTVSGYLPMATHALVHAESDGSRLLTTDEPRAAMLPVYRRLELDDHGWDDHLADVDVAMMATDRLAALLTDDLRRAGADAIVVSSASSRTAASLARLLAGHGIEVTGLTSARHRAAVESFGPYAHVLTYDEVDRLQRSTNAVYVDVAGSAEVTAAVRDRLGGGLTQCIVVGATHLRTWPGEPAGQDGTGPSTTLFNTGDREVELTAERGSEWVEALCRAAREELVPWAASWLKITRVDGLAAAEQTWRSVAAGHSDPLSAKVIRP